MKKIFRTKFALFVIAAGMAVVVINVNNTDSYNNQLGKSDPKAILSLDAANPGIAVSLNNDAIVYWQAVEALRQHEKQVQRITDFAPSSATDNNDTKQINMQMYKLN